MILGIGTDIVEVSRMARAMEKDVFLRKCFTEDEVTRCFARGEKAAQAFAGYFAAKESIAKALGIGFRNFGPRDIEVCQTELGKPYASLKFQPNVPRGTLIDISISHERHYAMAVAIIYGR